MTHDSYKIGPKVEIFDQKPSHTFIEGFYQSSSGVNQNATGQDEEKGDSEDKLDIAMIDDDTETLFSSTDKT